MPKRVEMEEKWVGKGRGEGGGRKGIRWEGEVLDEGGEVPCVWGK